VNEQSICSTGRDTEKDDSVQEAVVGVEGSVSSAGVREHEVGAREYSSEEAARRDAFFKGQTNKLEVYR